MPELTVKRILTNLINSLQESTPGTLLPLPPAYSGQAVSRVRGRYELRGAAAHKTSLPPLPAEHSPDHHICLTQQLSEASKFGLRA